MEQSRHEEKQCLQMELLAKIERQIQNCRGGGIQEENILTLKDREKYYGEVPYED